MTQPLLTLAQLRRPVHRREIILSFGCAAFAAPFAVRAQQPQIPVIGLLDTAPATALELTALAGVALAAALMGVAFFAGAWP